MGQSQPLPGLMSKALWVHVAGWRLAPRWQSHKGELSGCNRGCSRSLGKMGAFTSCSGVSVRRTWPCPPQEARPRRS